MSLPKPLDIIHESFNFPGIFESYCSNPDAGPLECILVQTLDVPRQQAD